MKETRIKRFNVSMRPSDHELLLVAANRSGMSLSVYLVSAALKQARKDASENKCDEPLRNPWDYALKVDK